MTPKYTAIMVEPRKHRALEFVIRNFHENLSSDWVIKIIVGDLNYTFAKNICKNIHSRIECINAHLPNLNSQTYSNFLCNPVFFTFIDTEMFLVFQTDTMINPRYKNTIYDFMKYDYVGAPWSKNKKRNKLFRGRVGNGGLSLRRKSKMLHILKKKPQTKYARFFEDGYFSLIGHKYLNKPSFEEAKGFSIETVYSKTYFGIHKCWSYLDSIELDALICENPDLKTLIELQ